MMSVVIGLGSLGIGLAYAGLGLLAVWETITLHRYRGWSRFGIGFALMAASCGPHHLVHGWHVLGGESVSWQMLAATLIGLPAGLAFVFLRFETMWGGQGERMVAASPDRAAMVAGGFTLVAGLLAAGVFADHNAEALWQAVCTSVGLATATAPAETGLDFTSVSFLANLFVTVTYGMVGWYLADCQVRRYLVAVGCRTGGCVLHLRADAPDRCHRPRRRLDAVLRPDRHSRLHLLPVGGQDGAQRLRDGLESPSAGRRRGRTCATIAVGGVERDARGIQLHSG
jgi:hypothetical protein